MFRYFIFLSLIAGVHFSTQLSEAADISCESIEDNQWFHIENVRICSMKKTTSIQTSSINITQETDDSVKVLSFNGNKNVVYLPVQVDKVFTNLSCYDAAYTSVTDIFKTNFKGLMKLEYLLLNNNEIKTITSDTFENLASLKLLHLCKFVIILIG